MTIFPLTKKNMCVIYDALGVTGFGLSQSMLKHWRSFCGFMWINFGWISKTLPGQTFWSPMTGTEQGIQGGLLDLWSLGLETVCFSSLLFPWGCNNTSSYPL